MYTSLAMWFLTRSVFPFATHYDNTIFSPINSSLNSLSTLPPVAFPSAPILTNVPSVDVDLSGEDNGTVSVANPSLVESVSQPASASEYA